MEKNIQQINTENKKMDVSRSTSNGMKTIKKNKISLTIFILFFLIIGNYALKAEAWGYYNANSEFIGADSLATCKTALNNDTLARIGGICIQLEITPNTVKNSGIWSFKVSNKGVETPFPYFIKEASCNTERTRYLDATKANILRIVDSCKTPGATPVAPAKAAGSAVSNVYTFLAPIGTMKEINTTDIGVYFNWIFKLAIGLCAALAVIMIIVGGVQYMGDESVFGKTDAKDRITKAILGLLIAIGSWVLLNTINPALTGVNGVSVAGVSVVVNLPDAGDGSVDSDFAKGTGSYSTNASISPGVTSAIAKLKQGWVISKFTVYSNNRMLIALKKGSETDNSNIIDIAPGLSGYSETAQAKTGDRKTPKGSWKILSIKTSPDNKPVYNKTGSNMGASFWLLSPMTSGERGIGMHGNKTGTLSGTYGCVRLKNADILALLPYVKVETPVIITN